MDTINIYAPIIIPTLNRFEHLKACVESLQLCHGVEKTEIYISVDFPPSEKYEEGHAKILKYLETGLDGFKEVFVFIQNTNLGAAGNLSFLRDKVFQKHDRYILTEDDNIFSPCFLEYINNGLELYKDDESVWAICAYNYPIDIPNTYKHYNNFYYAQEYSAWGVGNWKDKFYKAHPYVNRDFGLFMLLHKWRKIPWRTLRDLISSIKYDKLYGDLYRTLYLINNDYFCIFPTENLVTNNGHDGSGINCGNSRQDFFSKQPRSFEKHFSFKGSPNKAENKNIRNLLDKYFDIPFKSKIKTILQIFQLKYENPVDNKYFIP